jgi:hypothetical protein
MPSDGKTSALYQHLKDTAGALDLDLSVADDTVFRVAHRDQKNALNHPEEFRTLAEVDAFLRGFDHGHRPRRKLKLYSAD